MKSTIPMLALCALMTGCTATMPQSQKMATLLPQQTMVDAMAAARQMPETRYAEFEQQYREGKFEDPYWPLASQYEGFGQLVMPPSVRPGAAWTYISLGDDYLEAKDLGGAARAYWAALELVGKTVASRPDRERIVRVAFEGLEKVAEARGQQKWAKLMKFSSRLADTYLNSPQATKENEEFYELMKTIQDTQQGMEEEQQQAKSQMLSGLLMAATSGLAAANASSFATTAGLATIGATQVVDAGVKYKEAMEKITALNNKFNEKYAQFRMTVADDVESIEAGNSFVANATLFYLENATDPKPYISLMHSFAANKPLLKKLLAPYKDPEELELTKEVKEQLKNAFVQVEKFVALYERRGVEAPLQIAKTVWLDADTRLAAQEPSPAKQPRKTH